MDKLEKKFDNLVPTDKVKLLSTTGQYRPRILQLFHEKELCIKCGVPTVVGDRMMIAVDGSWPEEYFNLWEHKKCGK